MIDPQKSQTQATKVSRGAEGFVIAKCPEILGFAPQGVTREEALADLAAAIELRLDTMIENWRRKAAASGNTMQVEAGN